jgi:DNA-binding CsgD family transcriptional regulator
MATLLSCFETAAAGAGTLAFVVGEPGIGKTSLCEQMAAHVITSGGRVLAGRCNEEGAPSLPYHPFVEALQSYVVACPPEALRRELGTNAAEVARIVPELRAILGVEPEPPTDPESDRYRLLQAVTAFLRAIAAAQPLLLVLDDLHDADRGTLDMLIQLARQTRDARVLVVGAYRDVEVDRAHPLSGALAELRRAGPLERIRLGGLSVAEAVRVVHAVAGEQVPDAITEVVYRRTEGHPLFVQEVARYLVEAGMVAGAEGSESGGLPVALGIPEGLRDVIGRRLSRLSAECNRVLGVAAVIGREFALDSLIAVAGDAEGVVYDALDEAVRVGVLEEWEQRGTVQYRFAHALFRQTLYEELRAPRRIRLHQQVARDLEARYADRLSEHAAELAEHFSHSSNPDDLAKAVSYGELAAQRAAAVFAFGEAARLLEQALEVQEVLNPSDERKRCELLVALEPVLLPVGEQRRILEEVAPAAFALAESLGDRRLAFQAAMPAVWSITALYGTGAMRADNPLARLWTERADRYAEPGTRERITADVHLAVMHLSAGQLRAAWQRHRRALDVAREIGDSAGFFSAASMALLYSYPEDMAGRLALAQEVARRPRAGVPPDGLALALINASLVLLGWGDRAAAEVLWQEYAPLVEQSRFPVTRLYPITVDFLRATLDGRLETAVEASERLIARAVALGNLGRARDWAAVWNLWPLLHLGRGEAALAAQAAIGYLPPEGDATVPWSAAPSILCLAALGRTAEARGALARLPWDDDELVGTWHLLAALEAAVRVQDREAAAVLASRLANLAALASTGMSLTCVARHLGAAADLLGNHTGARAYTTQALAVAGVVQNRPELALSRLQLAELLAEGTLNERSEAQEHADHCIAELREMKMQPTLTRALALHDRLGAAQAGSTARSVFPDRLSAREVEVLRLLAAGKGNREIAEALVISPNTVERHINHIFAKTGVANRVEAATYAHRHGLAD